VSSRTKQNFRADSFGKTEQQTQLCGLMPWPEECANALWAPIWASQPNPVELDEPNCPVRFGTTAGENHSRGVQQQT
jgi:hypothetical protein